jgi:hypothetical protein
MQCVQDAIKVDPEQLVSSEDSQSCVALPAGPTCSDIISGLIMLRPGCGYSNLPARVRPWQGLAEAGRHSDGGKTHTTNPGVFSKRRFLVQERDIEELQKGLRAAEAEVISRQLASQLGSQRGRQVCDRCAMAGWV